MDQNLVVSLGRADELLADLLREYQRALDQKEVSTRAVHLTHEVCMGLRSVLDRVARRYWEKFIAPILGEGDRKAAKVYFPITANEQSLKSTLGLWKATELRKQHQAVYDYLVAKQPFSAKANAWLAVLNDLATQGKHIDLVPQTRVENRRVTVSRGNSAISWSGVRFSGNISVMGAPIDPRTQRIVPTPGVNEKVEIWVSFLISGHNVNAAAFCQHACREVRRIVTEVSNEFGL